MKSTSYELLVNAAGQLMQQHAFDHLSDEKLVRMQSCFRRIGSSTDNDGMANTETELLRLCSEANLFVESTTTQSLHQWYAAMSCFGMMTATQTELMNEGEE